MTCVAADELPLAPQVSAEAHDSQLHNIFGSYEAILCLLWVAIWPAFSSQSGEGRCKKTRGMNLIAFPSNELSESSGGV